MFTDTKDKNADGGCE